MSVDPYLVLLLLLTLPALFPLLAPGYFFSAHDGRHSIFFVSMFDEAIRDGAWWPRWAMHHNQGYGYPTFLVQAPLAFYAAEFFILLGAGITTAVKWVWALSFFASGWGVYALIRHWGHDDSETGTNWTALAALCAGLLYVYLPYHLLDVYVRAALAETVMLSWFPWVFLAFERLLMQAKTRPSSPRIGIAALALGGLLLSHVLALVAFLPLLALFLLYRLISIRGDRHLWIYTMLAGIGGLALAAIFWLPLLVEGPLLDQGVFTENTYSYSRHWVFPGQLFSSFWGYGFSDDPTGANDGMGFQIGLVVLSLALASPLLLRRKWRSESGTLIFFLVGATLAILFAISPAAAPLWRTLPGVEVIQFPWRLLALSGFTLSLLGGLLLIELLSRERSDEMVEASTVTFALLIVVASSGYARPDSIQPVEPWREDGRAIFRFEREHPDMLGYTRWVEQPFTSSPLSAAYEAEPFDPMDLPRLAIIEGEGEVLAHLSRGHTFGGEVELETAATVQVRVYYFPGWRAQVDGEIYPIRPSSRDGLVELDLPAGRHRIELRMGSTPVRSAGVLISLLTLVLLSGIALYSGLSASRADE